MKSLKGYSDLVYILGTVQFLGIIFHTLTRTKIGWQKIIINMLCHCVWLQDMFAWMIVSSAHA